MSKCKVQFAPNGKINKVLNQTGQPSKLFEQIFNTPILSLNQAIDTYRNIYAEKLQSKVRFQNEPVVNEKEAQKYLDFLSKKYGISSHLKSLGMFGSYGEFDTNTISISINRETTYNKDGKLIAAINPTGFIAKRTIYHEYLHPFVEILESKNKELYDEIYEKALAENKANKFTDVSSYVDAQQKEELVVRYLDRLSLEEKLPPLLERFLNWLGEFFHTNRENKKVDLSKLSKDTTVEELYDIFKNYGNLKDEISEVLDSKKIDREVEFLTSLINNPQLPEDLKEVYREDLRKLTARFQIIGEQGARNLDQVEEVTFRMDNLLIAKEMEQVGKSPKEIRLATGWEKSPSEFRDMTDETIINTLLQRGTIKEVEC